MKFIFSCLFLRHLHPYGEAARVDTCLFTSYGLAWSTMSGSINISAPPNNETNFLFWARNSYVSWEFIITRIRTQILNCEPSALPLSYPTIPALWGPALYRWTIPLSLCSGPKRSTIELSHYPCALGPSPLPLSYPTIPVLWGPALYRWLSHYPCALGPSALPLSYPTIPVLWGPALYRWDIPLSLCSGAQRSTTELSYYPDSLLQSLDWIIPMRYA